MEITFTKHAKEKFDILQEHGVSISQMRVKEVLTSPDHIDHSRYPLLFVQGILDSTHTLRIVYRSEGDSIIVITFYPGRISQYGKT